MVGNDMTIESSRIQQQAREWSFFSSRETIAVAVLVS